MRLSLAAEFVLLAALWGAAFLFMHSGLASFGPWAAAGVRVLVASAVMLPVLLLSGQWPALRNRALPILFVGALNAGIPFALYAYALQSISTGLAGILNATAPLFGALTDWLWLRDKPTRYRGLGLLTGFLGVAALSWDQADFNLHGSGGAVLAALGATLCYGMAATFTRKYLTGVPPLATSAGSQFGAALCLLMPTVVYWPTANPPPLAWSGLIGAGVLCSALGYMLYFRLIEKAGTSRTMSVTFLVPLFALLYGSLLLGEQVTPWMVACGGVILLGVTMATGLLPRPAQTCTPPNHTV